MKKLILLLCCALFLAAGCSKDKPGPVARVVEKSPAPEISVLGMDGDELTLSSLKGKVVLLNFWATWCPPCREEIPSMMKLNSFMEGKPFQMVCVSVDEGGPQAVKSFFASSGYSLPSFFDSSGQSARTYGVTGVPETFVIDKNGIMVKRVIGGLDWAAPDVIAYLENLMQ